MPGSPREPAQVPGSRAPAGRVPGGRRAVPPAGAGAGVASGTAGVAAAAGGAWGAAAGAGGACSTTGDRWRRRRLLNGRSRRRRRRRAGLRWRGRCRGGRPRRRRGRRNVRRSSGGRSVGRTTRRRIVRRLAGRRGVGRETRPVRVGAGAQCPDSVPRRTRGWIEHERQQPQPDTEARALAEDSRQVDRHDDRDDQLRYRNEIEDHPPYRAPDDLEQDDEVVDRDDGGPAGLAGLDEDLPPRRHDDDDDGQPEHQVDAPEQAALLAANDATLLIDPPLTGCSGRRVRSNQGTPFSP